MVFGLQFRFIAGGWLIHELTDQVFWLGVPGLLSAAVTLSLTIPAGLLADRADTRRLLVVGRIATGLTHLALAVLSVGGWIEIWMVLVWAALTGALGALTNPAGAALLPRLIDRAAMASAVSYTSAIWNGSRIIGPPAAAVVIAWVGVGHAFFVTAAGFLLSAALVQSIRLGPRPPVPALEPAIPARRGR